MKLEITFPIVVGLIDTDETPDQLAAAWARTHGVLASIKRVERVVPSLPAHELRVVGTPAQITDMFYGEPNLHSFASGDEDADAETLYHVFQSATPLHG